MAVNLARSVQAVRQWSDRHFAQIVRVALPTLFGLGAWITYVAAERPQNVNHRGYLENLSTTLLGTALTVLIVDALLREAERRRTRPVRFAAHQEALATLERFIGVWSGILGAATRLPSDRRSDLFTGPCIAHAAQFLHSIQTGPQEYMLKKHIEDAAKEISLMVDRCIQRYSFYIKAELIDALRHVEQGAFAGSAERLLEKISLGRFQEPPVHQGMVQDILRSAIDPFRRLRAVLAAEQEEFRRMPAFSEVPAHPR